MIVYNKQTGKILMDMPDDQPIDGVFHHYPEEIRENLLGIELNNIPKDLRNYRVINNELVRLYEVEIEELSFYGRVLTDEERLLNQLKPSHEEIKKAEQTIEILTLLSEVL